MNDCILDAWADAAGVTFHHGEALRGVSRDDLLQLMRATQAAERERCAKLCDEQERQWLEAARLCGGNDGNEVCRAYLAAELAVEIRA